MHAAQPGGQLAAVDLFPVEFRLGEGFGESDEFIAEIVGRLFDEPNFDQRLPRRTTSFVGTDCCNKVCDRVLLAQTSR